MELELRHGSDAHTVTLEGPPDALSVTVDGRRHDVTVIRREPGQVTLLVDGRPVSLAAVRVSGGVEVALGGRRFVLHDADDDTGGADDVAHEGDGRVTTPMPGKVVAVSVEEGAAVSRGQTLLVLESMKMQNDIAAPVDGVVASIRHAVGDSVEYGDVLVEITPDAAE